MIENYLESDSLAIENYEDACAVARVLLENEYAVMLSKEEDMFLLNWVWSECADRNDVIFINREGYEENWQNFLRAHPDLKSGYE